VHAARERVWDAAGTVDGPRHWWTTTVTGSAEAGGELRFGFAGLPEEMVMLVVASRRPASVTWRCVAHNRDQAWTGTQLSFELADHEPAGCDLTFRHTGHEHRVHRRRAGFGRAAARRVARTAADPCLPCHPPVG
jgi:hypothetical protein